MPNVPTKSVSQRGSYTDLYTASMNTPGLYRANEDAEFGFVNGKRLQVKSLLKEYEESLNAMLDNVKKTVDKNKSKIAKSDKERLYRAADQFADYYMAALFNITKLNVTLEMADFFDGLVWNPQNIRLPFTQQQKSKRGFWSKFWSGKSK